jgi:hypothetical protein
MKCFGPRPAARESKLWQQMVATHVVSMSFFQAAMQSVGPLRNQIARHFLSIIIYFAGAGKL